MQTDVIEPRCQGCHRKLIELTGPTARVDPADTLGGAWHISCLAAALAEESIRDVRDSSGMTNDQLVAMRKSAQRTAVQALARYSHDIS